MGGACGDGTQVVSVSAEPFEAIVDIEAVIDNVGHSLLQGAQPDRFAGMRPSWAIAPAGATLPKRVVRDVAQRTSFMKGARTCGASEPC